MKDKQPELLGCPHRNFQVDAKVFRLQKPKQFAISGYAADIRVECSECNLPFRFMGLPLGLITGGAAMSADRLEARLSIEPNTPLPTFKEIATSPAFLKAMKDDGDCEAGGLEPTPNANPDVKELLERADEILAYDDKLFDNRPKKTTELLVKWHKSVNIIRDMRNHILASQPDEDAWRDINSVPKDIDIHTYGYLLRYGNEDCKGPSIIYYKDYISSNTPYPLRSTYFNNEGDTYVRTHWHSALQSPHPPKTIPPFETTNPKILEDM